MSTIVDKNGFYVLETKVVDEEFIEEFGLPYYASEEAACMDFRAAIKEDVELFPNTTLVIPTGICIDINNPYVALWLLPRSGLGSNHGIVLGNLVGCIDSDYQGQIGVCVWNRSEESRYTISRGDKICQGQFLQVVRARLNVVKEFSRKSKRGSKGFGSTGVK